jgi:hypothetical protein
VQHPRTRIEQRVGAHVPIVPAVAAALAH